MHTSVAWDYELQSWLEPFLNHLHHPARRRMGVVTLTSIGRIETNSAA